MVRLKFVVPACLVGAVILLAVIASAAAWQPPKPLPGSSECENCHETGRRTGKREAGMPPAYDAGALRASPHATLECAGCHADADPKKLPHADKLAKVACGDCHPDEAEKHDQSLHGRAVARGDKSAPTCKTCHGTHNVLPPSNPRSSVAKMAVPKLCGGCHREGSEVSQTHNIPQTNILGNYADSIHGEGLFKREHGRHGRLLSLVG